MLGRDGAVDEALVNDYLRYLERNGAEGILVLGTTGEFASFGVAERKKILEVYLKRRGKLSLMCQVGTSNLPETLDLLAHATAAGAEQALVVPPFYLKNPSVDGLARYYDPILRAARLPVLLYHIPQNSGVPITPELLTRLSTHERLYGVKDSFSKAEVLQANIRAFPNLRFFAGVTANIEVDLREGGAGTISGNGSLYPRQTAAIFQAWREHGDVHAAQQRFDEAAAALTGFDGIPAMKFALGRLGMAESPSRAPFTELSPEKKQELIGRLVRVGVLAS
jgi:4-hydroxy-tetrahydrodipicolinate synthase